MADDLRLPAQFPADNWRRLADRVTEHLGDPQRSHWAGAWNAVRYRFRAMADDGNAYTDLLDPRKPKDGMETRYQQERALFGFFANGYATVESFAYACNAIGSAVAGDAFPLDEPGDARKAHPLNVMRRYQRTFPTQQLGGQLKDVLGEPEYRRLSLLRNILLHRLAPSRAIFRSAGPGDPQPDIWQLAMHGLPDLALDASMANAQLTWLGARLEALMDALEAIVDTRLLEHDPPVSGE